MPTDPSAVAESIIVHAETLCEREDHFWDVIRQLSIPVPTSRMPAIRTA